MLKEKLPTLCVAACCCAVLIISGIAKKAEEAHTTMADADKKQVIVLDAGHGGYALSIVA